MPGSTIPPISENLSWWREVAGIFAGAAVTVVCWSFFAGRKSKEFEQKITSIGLRQDEAEKRITTIEAEQKSTADECLSNRKEIIEELKVEILRIVQQAMTSAAVDQVERAGELRTNIAVIQALLGEMQEDMRKMSERLDRRQVDVYPLPHGERRDQ